MSDKTRTQQDADGEITRADVLVGVGVASVGYSWVRRLDADRNFVGWDLITARGVTECDQYGVPLSARAEGGQER